MKESAPGPRSWTAAVGAAMRARLARRRRVLADTDRWRRNSFAVQARTLRDNLARAADTQIGRARGFARLVRIDDDAQLIDAYRAAVPVGDWYTVMDDIARMREDGQPGVLWPGLVGHFAQTSGTTAGDKYIPVTREMFRSNYRASLDIFAHLLNRGIEIERVMSGRCLFLGGSSDLRRGAHGIVTGDLSGLVTPMIRWPLSAIYAPGKRVALMSDWPEKIEAMAQQTAGQDIRFVSGMPSWTHALLVRVLELTGAERILDVWPHLSVFVHGGVRYDPFRARLGEVLTSDRSGDFDHRLELYPASEGFIALQDQPGARAMRLNTDLGNFFEFVPVESLDDDGSIPADAPAFDVGTVEPGVRCCVVISSCAGLWRYNIGDVVEFEDVPDGPARTGTGPARLRIVGRHRHFINAFGENLIVEHIEHAVAHAAERTGAAVGEFTAAPVYPAGNRPAGLELVVEVRGPTPAGFAAAFDESLKAQNVDYTTKREADLGMAPPTVTAVEPGTFDRWLASRGKLGGQHKCPRCANHREHLEGVLHRAGAGAGTEVRSGAQAAAEV